MELYKIILNIFTGDFTMPKQLTLLGGLLAAVLFSVAAVQAEDMDYYWTGASNSNYFTTGNWNVGAPDGETATASLDSAGNNITAYMYTTNGTVSFDYSHLGNAVYTLNIGQAEGSGTALLSRTGGDLTIANGKTVSLFNGGTLSFIKSGNSFYQNGTVNVSGGNLAVTTASTFRLGNDNNASYPAAGTLENIQRLFALERYFFRLLNGTRS